MTSLFTGVAVGAHRIDPRVGRRRSHGEGLQLLAHVHGYVPYPRGGAEVSFHAVLLALRELGHRVEVVSESAPEPYHTDGIAVVPATARARAQHYPRADAVLSVIDPPAHDVRLDALRHGTTLVMFDFNGAVVGERPRSVDLWVLNADWLWQQLPRRLAENALVVHSPIDPNDHRTEPGIHVTLVNLSAWKGAPQFFELARRLPDVRFLGVTGAWGEQLEPPSLPNLTVIEHQADARDVYRRTRILVMPSASEVHPRTPLEAGVSGIPCIAHPSPGAVEALGPAGIFVHRDDIDGWCREVRRLQDPDEHTDAGAHLRSWTTAIAIAQLSELEQLSLALEQLVS